MQNRHLNRLIGLTEYFTFLKLCYLTYLLPACKIGFQFDLARSRIASIDYGKWVSKPLYEMLHLFLGLQFKPKVNPNIVGI